MPVRTQVTVPLRFPDGYATTAEVMTFDGLADGKEHLALRLGTPGPTPLVRLHSECNRTSGFGPGAPSRRARCSLPSASPVKVVTCAVVA